MTYWNCGCLSRYRSGSLATGPSLRFGSAPSLTHEGDDCLQTSGNTRSPQCICESLEVSHSLMNESTETKVQNGALKCILMPTPTEPPPRL